jgi:UDP-N-acetylglucosamine--N-acetylmuramyl-(pentapeptide) pyrophosphoryl-undecaprenol N-acetylglucosamine transferase
MSGEAPILLAAGGTGGHLFPAAALAAELDRRGAAVDLVTDERVGALTDDFAVRQLHRVRSATFGSRAPQAILAAAWRLGGGFGESLALLRRLRPAVVVGFGGYPTVPPLAAAQLLRIPTILHEQNAVMGRANRLLARGATAVATGFPTLAKASAAVAAKTRHVGNPVRPAVLAAAAQPYPADAADLALLVFGGSQGARVMADVVPPAIAQLDATLRARLSVVQQARPEDDDRVVSAYRNAGVRCEVEPFFRDLPARMAASRLVIGRAGASTVAEIAVVGRASILVPLPHSLDQDQLENAHMLEAAGGATVVIQDRFTPRALTALLTDLLADPAGLARRAEAARSIAVPDAAARLADLVLETARGNA